MGVYVLANGIGLVTLEFALSALTLAVLLFVAGFTLNTSSDRALRGLRAPGETDYRVPHGGGFRWVSSPNYLGEIIEWCGWALATWSLAGLTFAVYTTANLAPRVLSHHAWYQDEFKDYPANRRALVPYLRSSGVADSQPRADGATSGRPVIDQRSISDPQTVTQP